MSLKRFFFLFLLVYNSIGLFSQNYGNEWVDYTSIYYKFPIYKEGVYRIDSATIAQKFSLSTLNPKNFHLYIKGQEHSIYVKGETDNLFNTDDYIEFYASHYRRGFDSLIYTAIKYNPNPYAPLFNDTLYAYLTYKNTASAKHITEETDSTIANYPISNYHYKHLFYSTKSDYNYVIDAYNSASDARYTQAEAYGSPITKGNVINIPFGSLNVYTNTPLPSYVNINYSGASEQLNFGLDHQIRITYTDFNSSVLTITDTLFKSHAAINTNTVLDNQSFGLSSGFSIASVSNPSFTSFNNKTILHSFEFYYPKINTLDNQLLSVVAIDDATSNTKASFLFSNPNPGSTGNLIAYDITNNKKIPAFILGGNARLVVPNSGSRKEVVICSESNTIAVTNLIDVNNNSTFTKYNSAALNKPFVLIYNNKLAASAEQYRQYRASGSGGGYNVIKANVEAIYDQFGYGIPKHPQAIRNFIRFLHDSLSTPPEYVLLIGKGVQIQNLYPANQQYNLIPTMGYPSSDNLLTAGITNTLNSYQEIPIGRIAATDNVEVTNYLTKVQQLELATGEQEWKKKVLHFIGGDTPQLTLVLSNYMNTYKATIQDTLIGAEVHSFQKNSTSPIQYVISDSIKELIKNGASLITFFGHGSSAGFDQAIDDPTLYNNTNKYPFVVANSCYSGDIFIPGDKSVSEKFVFAPQEGSIGFLSTTSSGYVNALHYFTTNFYDALSYKRYNKGIGDVIKYAAEKTSISFDLITRYTSFDFSLHGDPAIKISVGTLPDYKVNNQDVSFDIETYPDSLGIAIKYSNIGMAVKDSLFLRIERFFPNGDSTNYLFEVTAPYSKDSLKFYMPIDFYRGIGLNRFKVKLDYFNEIQESIESNNSTNNTVDYFIKGNDVIPVYPYQYAIVPKTNTIVLKASTSDPFAPVSNYVLQLDTNDKFINPIQTYSVTSSGGVIQWTVNIPFADSTVYFWRVSKDSVSPSNSFRWKESSFQTIDTKRGWSQAHFNQFKNDNYNFVKYNPASRQFEFVNNIHSIKVRNGIYPYLSPVAINFFFNNINLSSWG
ncbi:MAG: C25 family cysteine peptidase, partial [Bacteroidia bacterium]